MITKEDLVKNRDQANTAFLRIKQTYKHSNEKKYLVVEGKDDVAYYRCIFVRYVESDTNFEILVASNRANVVKTYDLLDWTIYSKNRVLLFVDRDLSDITNEYTPDDINVYVTDEYSIENSLFTEELMRATLRVFYGLDNMSDEEVEVITGLYRKAKSEHENLFLPVMCWILHWRQMQYKCNLNNLNSSDLYKIATGRLIFSSLYTHEEVARIIHKACGVDLENVDLSLLEKEISINGGIRKFMRGKFVRDFFVKYITSVTLSLSSIFPYRKNPKAVVTLGQGNALQILCGYMATPQSLSKFMSRIMSEP